MKNLILALFITLAAASVARSSAGDPIPPDAPMTSGNTCADLSVDNLLNVAPTCGQFWRLTNVSIVSGYNVAFPSPLHLVVQENGVVIRHSIYNSLSQLEAAEYVTPLADSAKISINLFDRQVQLGYETCDHVWLYFEGFGKATGGAFTACANIDAFPDPLGCHSITCPQCLGAHSL